MKKVFFTLILCCLLCPPSWAEKSLKKYEEECLSIIDAPKVRVTAAYGKLKYDHQQNGAYLKRETQKKYREQNTRMPDEFTPIGLTKVRDGFDFNMTVSQIDISNGYSCLYPEAINTHLGYYNPTIYIMKGLKKDSCLYNLAVRHEKTHMQIYIEALDYFLPAFKAKAENLFPALGVKIIKRKNSFSRQDAEELNNLYLNTLKNDVDKWRKEVEAEQMKLDSVENYTIENRLCQELEK